MQVWSGANALAARPGVLPDPWPDAICRAGTGHDPAPPAHPPSHDPECGVCPALARLVPGAMLLPAVAAVPAPTWHAWAAPAVPPAAGLVPHRHPAGQARAPPPV